MNAVNASFFDRFVKTGIRTPISRLLGGADKMTIFFPKEIKV